MVECEALGPLTVLAPGQSTDLTVEFGFGENAGPVVDVAPGGYWSRPTGADASGEARRVFTAVRGGTPDGDAGPRREGPGTAADPRGTG